MYTTRFLYMNQSVVSLGGQLISQYQGFMEISLWSMLPLGVQTYPYLNQNWYKRSVMSSPINQGVKHVCYC